MAPNREEKERYSQREILRRLEDNLTRLEFHHKSSEEKINNIYFALVGQPDLEVHGLFKRVDKLEKSENNRSKFYILITSMAAGISVGCVKLYDFLFKHQ